MSGTMRKLLGDPSLGRAALYMWGKGEEGYSNGELYIDAKSAKRRDEYDATRHARAARGNTPEKRSQR